MQICFRFGAKFSTSLHSQFLSKFSILFETSLSPGVGVTASSSECTFPAYLCSDLPEFVFISLVASTLVEKIFFLKEHCGNMPIAQLRSRLNDLHGRVPSSAPRSTSSARAGTSAGGQGDLRVTVWNKAPTIPRSTPPSSTVQPVSVPNEPAVQSSDLPRVSFGAPEEDVMSIAASELRPLVSSGLHHPVQMLRDMHEGRTDPGLFDELRAATDLALRATKVTARPLGQAGLFGGAVEDFAQQFSTAQKQTEALKHVLPRRPTAASTQPLAQAPQPARRRGRPPAVPPPLPYGPSSSLHPGRPVEETAGTSLYRRKPAYQYAVLPFGLALSPRVFTKVVEAALVPLREHGVRILNYLDDWLILAHSRDQVCEHRDLLLRHLARLGLRGQLGEEQTLPRAEDLFSRYGNRLGRHVRAAYERARAVTADLPSSIRGQECGSTESISEAPGAYGIRSRSNNARIASYETASALASRSSPEVGMATRHAPSPSDSDLQ
ncbi:hypothetical protein PO909_025438 [Leuciscus waleckii]